MPRSRETRAAGRRRVAAGVALAVVSALAVIQVAGAAPGERRPITGTDRGETIFGTRHADTIRGRGGADRIVARARGDRVFGGAGFDKLRGGRGGDRLVGQRDGALLIGGSGRDEFNMRAGERIAGGGRDVIRARDGRPDEINCGAGVDVAYVDRVEDGVYDCERVVMPDGVVVDR